MTNKQKQKRSHYKGFPVIYSGGPEYRAFLAIERAKKEYLSGQHEESLQILEEEYEREDCSYRIALELFKSYFEKADKEKAAMLVEDSADRFANNPHFLPELIRWLFMFKEQYLQLGIEIYNRILSTEMEISPEEMVNLEARMGRLYSENDKTAEAVIHYETAYALSLSLENPSKQREQENTTLSWNMACAYYDVGDAEKCAFHLDKIKDISSEFAGFGYLAKWAYKKTGQKSSLALVNFNEACRCTEVTFGMKEQGKHQAAPTVSITSLSVDLKQLEDGSIALCEINMLPSSGTAGYNKIHKTTARANIVSDYRRLASSLRYQGFEFSEDIIKYNFQGYQGFSKAERIIESLNQPSDVQLNSCFQAWISAYHKDIFFHDIEELSLTSRFAPASIIAGKYEKPTDIVRKVKANIPESECYIVKPCTSAVGDGVMLVTQADLENAVTDICRHSPTSQALTEDFPDIWEHDYYPNFLVQEYARSAPARASNGLHYDATMRVLVTIAHNHETGETDISYHGCWWKLPEKSLEETADGSKAFISQPPSKIKQDEKENRIFSARVSPVRQKQVKDQLTEFFTKFGPHISKPNEDVAQYVFDRIHAPSDEMMPADMGYAALSSDYIFGNMLASHDYILNIGSMVGMRGRMDFQNDPIGNLTSEISEVYSMIKSKNVSLDEINPHLIEAASTRSGFFDPELHLAAY